MGKPYEIDEGKVRWAERRVDELGRSEINIGLALEKMNDVPNLLIEGAAFMDNQPESEMARDFAARIEMIRSEMESAFKSWMNDRSDINDGIINYRKGGK